LTKHPAFAANEYDNGQAAHARPNRIQPEN